MNLLLASSASLQPVGPLGAAITAGALVVAIAYGIGALERRHWGGRPPTAQEYLHGKRRMGRVQYSTSQWSQRVLWADAVALVLGAALLMYGLLA